MSIPNYVRRFPSLKIGLALRSECQEIASLLGVSFANGEPMCRMLGVTADEYAQFCLPYVHKSLEDGLLTVGKPTEEGKIICAVVVDDLCTPMKPADVSAKFAPLAAMHSDMMKYYCSSCCEAEDKPCDIEKCTPGVDARILMAGDDPSVQHKGLVIPLFDEVEHILASRNFKHAIGVATGDKTQLFLAQRHYETLRDVNYADFEVDGKKVFADAVDKTGSTSCTLVRKTFTK